MALVQLAFILALIRCYLHVPSLLGYEKQRLFCDYFQKYETCLPAMAVLPHSHLQLVKDLV